MSINSGLVDTAAAPDPAGTATLPDQSQQTGNNTIVFVDTIDNDTDIAADLASGADYTGRLVMLRRGDPDEEVRFITTEAAGTGTTRLCTVSEDWDSVPVVGDTFFVCYLPIDADQAEGQGFKVLLFRAQDWVAADVIEIGNGTDFAWFSFLEGHSLETDDNSSTTVAAYSVLNNGRLDFGYKHSGQPVSGGYFVGTPAVAGEFAFDAQAGSDVFFYDFLMSNVFNNKVELKGNLVAEKAKFFSGSYIMDLSGNNAMNNCVIEGLYTTNETLLVTSTSALDTVSVISTNGFITASEASVVTTTLRNIVFINNLRLLQVEQNNVFNMINPTWAVDTASQNDIDFLSATGTAVNEQYSLDIKVAESDGTLLGDANVIIYENSTDNLVVEAVTVSGVGTVSDAWTYKTFTDNTTTLSVTTYSNHALRVDKWLYSPFVAAQTSNVYFNGIATLSSDSNISQTNHATALSDGSGITWYEDTNPSSIIDYTATSGSLNVGDVVTASPSGASGTVTKIISGNSIAGTVHLKLRNTTAFANSDTLSSDGGGSWTGGAYTADSEQEFTIWVESNSKSLQIVHDYMASLTSQNILSATGELVHEWGRDVQTRSLYKLGSDFFTERSYIKGIIFVNYGAGNISYFTDDAGGTWVPPTTYTHTVTGLESGTEITYALISDRSEVFHVESASTSDGAGKYKTEYSHSGGEVVDILVHHVNYQPDVSCIYDITLPSSDATVKVQMFTDDNYLNP